MSHYTSGARHTLTRLIGLDFGVRVETRSLQRTLFSGADRLSAQGLVSELAETVSSLRVYSYALRGQLEQITYALQANVAWGSWRFARRAALDLSGLLGQAAKRQLAGRELCIRGANCALRIAELCSAEVR
jgi:hypothetical protein